MLSVLRFVGKGYLDENTVGIHKKKNNHDIKNQLERVVGKHAKAFAFLVGRLGLHQKDPPDGGNDADQNERRNGKAPSPEVAQHDPEKFQDDDDKKHVVNELENGVRGEGCEVQGGMYEDNDGPGHEKDGDNEMDEVIDPKENLPELLDKLEMDVMAGR
jgi:hypothetical protein